MERFRAAGVGQFGPAPPSSRRVEHNDHTLQRWRPAERDGTHQMFVWMPMESFYRYEGGGGGGGGGRGVNNGGEARE